MVEQKEELAVIELFKDKTRREALTFAIEEMEEGRWYAKREIEAATDVSSESLRLKIGALIAFGVLDVRGEDGTVLQRPLRDSDNINIPHYRIADTEVVDLLKSWDGYPLNELFYYTGAQKLVRFFLTRADPSTSYSYNAIQKQSDVGYQAASNHMDTLVDAGLIHEVEGKRSTEYTLDTDAPILSYLIELNEAIARTYNDRL